MVKRIVRRCYEKKKKNKTISNLSYSAFCDSVVLGKKSTRLPRDVPPLFLSSHLLSTTVLSIIPHSRPLLLPTIPSSFV